MFVIGAPIACLRNPLNVRVFRAWKQYKFKHLWVKCIATFAHRQSDNEQIGSIFGCAEDHIVVLCAAEPSAD